jgi:Domain of unknown function (DUF4386)
VMEPNAEASPRKSRIIGVVYFLYFLTAILGAFLTPHTANNILAQEPSFWLGFAFTLISFAFYIALTVLFYQLFKSVNPSLALLAAFFSLVGCTILAFGSLFQLAPLVMLGSGSSLAGFTVEQSESLAQLFLELYVRASDIGLVFFGCFNLLIGYLITRSTFLPRILGALMVLSGLGWLIFLSPPLANSLRLYIEFVGILAEGLLMLWLLVKGVNVSRSGNQTSAAGQSLE